MLNYNNYEIEEFEIEDIEDNDETEDAVTDEFVNDESKGFFDLETDLDEIGLIRKREDLNEVEYALKTNIFGRTSKKKVAEYLNAIRDQHKKSEERFNQNLKEVYHEKEELKKKWEENQAYIVKLETENSEIHEKMKKTDRFNSGTYDQEIAILEDSLAVALAENRILESDKESLILDLESNNKHISEIESRYNEMTSRILEMEKIDVNNEREQMASLEVNIASLTKEIEKKDKDIAQYEKQLEAYSKEFESLKNSYSSIVVAHDNNKSLLIDSQKSLLEKENIISENSRRYEKQSEELNNQFQRQLSEVAKNLESAHNMVVERDQAIRVANNANQARFVEIESNYQIKLDSMMKNLLQKDDQINQFAKSLEETAHSSKLLENENKSLKKNADSFKSGLNRAMEKIEEYTKLNNSLLEELEEERLRNVEILKDKITLEINYSAKEQKVSDLNYEVEVLSKWNEKLTSQMEQERETAKELIAQFGTTRAVNTKID